MFDSVYINGNRVKFFRKMLRGIAKHGFLECIILYNWLCTLEKQSIANHANIALQTMHYIRWYIYAD